MSRVGKHFVAAGVWVLLIAGIYFAMNAYIQPKVATAGNVGEIVIARSRDAHFYVAGEINGQAVTFMVDTGASSVSVGAVLAERLGLPRGRPVTVGTANGSASAEEISGQTISLGGFHVRDVRIVVLRNMGDQALLGQNVLRYLDVLQTSERMILRPRKP